MSSTNDSPGSSSTSSPPPAMEDNLIDWDASLAEDDVAALPPCGSSPPIKALTAKAKKRARRRAAEEAAAVAAAAEYESSCSCSDTDSDAEATRDGGDAATREALSPARALGRAVTACIKTWVEEIHVVAPALVVASYVLT